MLGTFISAFIAAYFVGRGDSWLRAGFKTALIMIVLVMAIATLAY